MQIVIVAPDLEGKSGWSRYALDIARALVARGNEVHAIVHRASLYPPCSEYPIVGSPHAMLVSPLRRWWSGVRVHRLLKKVQPDIVHFMAELYALLLSSVPKTARTCLTIHGTYAVVGPATFPFPPRGKGLGDGGLARAYREIDCIFSVSTFTKNEVREKYPQLFHEAGLEQKIIVVPNGVDLSRARSKARMMPEVRRILGVGPVKSRKGYCEAIEALAVFRRTYGVRFVYEIIGSMDEDPAYVDRLKTCIAKHNLTDSVVLRGSVSDAELGRAYQRTDVFLLLSLQDGLTFEGFGLVFLEANSWGVPVIGPKTGGCPEAIDEGRSGYVCDPFDAPSIAGRLRDILISYTIDRADCLAWASAHSIEQVAEKLEERYRILHDENPNSQMCQFE